MGLATREADRQNGVGHRRPSVREGDAPTFAKTACMDSFGVEERRVVVCVGREVWVCDAETGKVLHNRPHEVKVLTFSPDGSMLALRTQAKVVEFRDPVAGRKIGSITAQGLLYCLGFSADGKQIGGLDTKTMMPIPWWSVR